MVLSLKVRFCQIYLHSEADEIVLLAKTRLIKITTALLLYFWHIKPRHPASTTLNIIIHIQTLANPNPNIQQPWPPIHILQSAPHKNVKKIITPPILQLRDP